MTTAAFRLSTWCSRCAAKVEVLKGPTGNLVPQCPHFRPMAADAPRGATGSPQASRPYARAVPTTCAQGHNHPSRVEAKWCDYLTADVAVEGGVLFRQVRFPLLAIAGNENGVPLAMTLDFVIWRDGRIARVVDAKGRGSLRSREWRRGARAFEATFHVKVEEVS